MSSIPVIVIAGILIAGLLVSMFGFALTVWDIVEELMRPWP